jgi:hypothetical protein
MALDPKVHEELLAKHPRAVVFTATDTTLVIGEQAIPLKGDTVVVIPPSRQIWRRFRACMADERKKPDSFEMLLKDCLVHPAPEVLESMLDRRPALSERLGDAVADLAGAGLEVEKNG